MAAPDQPGDVTWDALWKLFGLFGAILAAAWGLLMRMIWSRPTTEGLEAHLRDDAHRFESLEKQSGDLKGQIKAVESHAREDTQSTTLAITTGFNDIRADIRQLRDLIARRPRDDQ